MSPLARERFPGEEWVLLDRLNAAEAYLHSLEQAPPEPGIRIERQPFPNPEGLFARVYFPGRVLPRLLLVAEAETAAADAGTPKSPLGSDECTC
ncbi:MAG: hypothetical protein SFZ03_03880 [Candidatus Melainabacteria bacterium]|nr:hypothetical protein [Candidatus Melainabacteria bacterium]